MNYLKYLEATHGWLPLVVEIYLANRGQSVATVNKSYRLHGCLANDGTIIVITKTLFFLVKSEIFSDKILSVPLSVKVFGGGNLWQKYL